MIEKIKQSLLASGLLSVPDDPTAPLSEYGLDSLMMVMFVLDLQTKFSMTVPASEVNESNLRDLGSIERLLKRLGAK